MLDRFAFDVGANIGQRTELFCAIRARTVAVEPQSACVGELRRRFGEDPKVSVAPVAVGSQPGTAEIAVCDADPTISMMSERWRTDGRFANREWHRRETVAATTLDQLIDEFGRPRFCKIDVEGFERPTPGRSVFTAGKHFV
jgi:FkbM family methyltransferase